MLTVIISWINPNTDNTNQSKICPNCGQDNDRYGPYILSTNQLRYWTGAQSV